MVICEGNQIIITLLQYYFICKCAITDIQDMMKLSCSQGFGLRGTNCEELLVIRVLVVALVKALVDLVQTHPPQGGLIWLVRQQVVKGPGSGLVGSV